MHQNNKFDWFPYLTYFNPCKAEEIGIAKNKNCMSKTLEMIMFTATMRRGEADAAIEFSANPISAFVGRVIEARSAKAKHHVSEYLAACSNERLMQLGLSAEDIRAVRTGTFQGVRG